MSRPDYDYKVKAISAAKGLGYPTEILEAVKKSQNANEIDRIMANARRNYL